jgi:hypothetical protein
MSIERVTTTAIMYGQKMQNVMNFDNNSGLTPAQICTEIRDNWIGTTSGVGIHQWCTQSTVWVQVACQTRSSSLAPPEILTINQPGVQGASNELIPFACVILKFKTEAAGRKGRGRIYTPCVMNGFSTQGLMNSNLGAYGNTALAAMNARYTLSGSGPITLVVGPKSGITLADYHYVTNISFSPFIGVQRRRNVGFGI